MRTPFSLKQLEIFIAVAEQLSITNAAKSLHVTQPAISRQIKALETHCKSPLIEQVGKKIYLTPAGNLFLSHARSIMKEVEALKISLAQEEQEINGDLSLGMMAPLQHIIFSAIKHFTKKHPQAQFEINIGSRSSQMQLLQENKIDFCLTATMALKPECRGLTLAKFPMLLVAAAHHPLANKRRCSVKQLANETFIVGDKDSDNYIQTQALLRKIKKDTPTLMVIDNQEAIKYAVQANLGIAYLPYFIVELELSKKILVPLTVEDNAVALSRISWTQSFKRLSPTAEKFKTFLIEFIKRQYQGVAA